MMREFGNVVMTLCDAGQQVRITCDAGGWTVEHDGQIAYRATDARQVYAFLHGLARISNQ